MQHNEPQDDASFSRIRRILWPIKQDELKKFLPTAIILFLLLFSYVILRTVKDSLVVYAAGAEVLPYLKSGLITPLSLVTVAIFTKLFNTFSREKIFYFTLVFFVSFYLVFALTLYPHRELWQPRSEWIESCKLAYPSLTHVFSILKNWVIVLYYVLAEFWIGVTVSLMFWQFANEITSNIEAKRFYAMFAFIGHLGPAIASFVLQGIAQGFISENNTNDECQPFLLTSMLVVALAAIFAGAIMRYMCSRVLIDSRYYSRSEEIITGKDKTKLSMIKSFKYILSSRYILLIFLMLVCYQLSMNLTGYLWKANAKTVHASFLGLVEYNAGFYLKTSVATSVLVILYNSFLYRFSWKYQSLITPIVLGITTAIYFLVLKSGDSALLFLSWISNDLPTLLLILSASQNLLSRSCKYSIFDPIKEMTYIPCDKELRTKGKAAVEVFGYSFAKGVGGWVAIFLLSFVSKSIKDASSYIIFICAILLMVWFVIACNLNKLYTEKLKTSNSS